MGANPQADPGSQQQRTPLLHTHVPLSSPSLKLDACFPSFPLPLCSAWPASLPHALSQAPSSFPCTVLPAAALAPPSFHTHAHTNTHGHTCSHTCAHTGTHVCTHTQACTHTHARAFISFTPSALINVSIPLIIFSCSVLNCLQFACFGLVMRCPRTKYNILHVTLPGSYGFSC